MTIIETLKEKIMEPMLPCHIVNFTLSMALLICVSGSKTSTGDRCGFDGSEDVCSYSISTGVFGLIFASAFIACEAAWEKISHLHVRVYYSQMFFGCVMSLSCFISFLSMATKWAATGHDISKFVSHANIYLSIIFSLLGGITWAALVYLSYLAKKGNEFSASTPLTSINMGGIERLTYRDPVTSSYQGPRDI